MEPLTDWSEDSREQHMHRVVRGGWMRLRPFSLTFLLSGVVMGETPLTRAEMARFTRSADNPEGDLAASCWGDVDEDEQADVPRQQEEAARYAAQYGLPPLRTHEDVLNLLIAAGLIYEIPDAVGTLRLHPAWPLPSPADVLPLSDEERAIQQQMRIEAAYEGDSNQIINLFDPAGERKQELTTSLQRLARLIEGSPFDARQAVLILLDSEDFTANVDVAHVPEHKVFKLYCDWEEFDANRICIHGRNDKGQIVITPPANWETEPAD
ncbi:hypothetical protein H3146_04015 [Streptomyces sp. OF3]|uniref:Uncharacterized protein n=1 Tax=Streptomyces alkaliterrae TaxID=2213162 RepID=A0A7W3WHL8_9ACTN|nr:DUF6042 family protein [Streptomyces alkaliterrae]MBB1252541.1 hypothetical protein [Streptomyces alkaliterrae]